MRNSSGDNGIFQNYFASIGVKLLVDYPLF